MTNYSFQDDLRNIAMVGGANPHQTDQELHRRNHQEGAGARDYAGAGAGHGAADRHAGRAGRVRGGGLQRARELAGIFLHAAFHSFEREQGYVEGLRGTIQKDCKGRNQSGSALCAFVESAISYCSQDPPVLWMLVIFRCPCSAVLFFIPTSLPICLVSSFMLCIFSFETTPRASTFWPT